jgi:hypothetical protein
MQSLPYTLKDERGETIAALSEGVMLALLQAGVINLVLSSPSSATASPSPAVPVPVENTSSPATTSPLPEEAPSPTISELQLSDMWGDLTVMRAQMDKLNVALCAYRKTPPTTPPNRVYGGSAWGGVVVSHVKSSMPNERANHHATAQYANHLSEVVSKIDSEMDDIHGPDDEFTP